VNGLVVAAAFAGLIVAHMLDRNCNNPSIHPHCQPKYKGKQK
jgi:hypothetical protein